MGGRGGSARSSAEGPTATQTPAETPAAGPAMSQGEQAIRQTFINGTESRGQDTSEWLSLADLRDGMAARGITSRADQDREILTFVRARKGVLNTNARPEAALSQRDIDATITQGNEPKRLFKVLR